MEESLPNITGKIEKAITNSAQNNIGALKRGVTTTGMMGAGPYGNYDLKFDASLSSSVYQDNAHVRPLSIATAFLIRY